MSIDDISPPSPIDTSLVSELPRVARVPAITSSLDGNASEHSRDNPAQEAAPFANTGFDEFQADLGAQATPTLSRDLGNDLTSLLKDLTSGNTSAAKLDVSKVQADLQTHEASSVAGGGTPLDPLISKISDSLTAGSVQGAPQDDAKHDLANFLVENGRGQGGLINTSA